ncbi:MFS transporter [Streptomyces sp. ISL-100]|uniref:MFS transporter n=1 Tax=Streptomyces sp. ISL-100 TaxID=2819173 RepID=UPI001BEAD9D6|nr:MFS transporter [Streptomyces sp. ISL-100]MBT2395741.1 MFS transporter [Streptomyces sp. ISL-100]
MKTSVTRRPTIVPPPGPVRRFTLVVLLRSVGSGLFMTGSALFFTRVVGLSIGQVGFGLSLAAGIGLLTMVPIGRLADRFGGKPVYLLLLVVQALSMGAYVVVGSFWAFLLVACLSAVADRGTAGTIGALVHGLGNGGSDRVLVRSYLRSTGNMGLSAGALLAGVALQADTAVGYTLLIAGNALMLLTAAAVLCPLPIAASGPQTGTASRQHGHGKRKRWGGALRDRRYMTLTALSGIATLHYHILAFAMPLWVANWTSAPRWMISGILVANTVLIVLFQVRTGQLATTLTGAARAARLAGVFLALACAVIGFSADAPLMTAVLLLALWGVIHSVGELLQASSEFCLSFELAPDDAQGEYQSTFALGEGIARVVAPGLLSVTVLSIGTPAWLGVGSLLLGACLATSFIALRASRELPVGELLAPEPTRASP